MSTVYHFIICLLLVFQGSIEAAGPESPPAAPPSAEVPFTPPNPSEPVFPIEDLIGKPTPETDRFLSEFVSMLATLGLIIASILILAWFLKRMVNAKMEQANTSSTIKIVDKRNLSPRTVVYMIEVNGKGILVAESHNGIACLGEYPPEDVESEDETPESKIPAPFKHLLSRNDKQ